MNYRVMATSQPSRRRDTDGPAGNRGEAEAGGVRSIQRAFRLLECLDARRPHATLTDFVKLSGLATTTVKRQLDTLEAEDLLRRLPDGRYTHGARLVRIAVSVLHGIELHDLAEPHLADLSEETGETANFAILDDDGNAMYLRQTVSRHAIRHVSWLGRSIPTRGTAIGDALHARVGANGTVTTRKTLEPDVTAIAAPVYAPDGGIAGAISVTGPSFRIDDETAARYGARVAAHARDLTQEIGGGWPHGAAKEQETTEETEEETGS